jgi:hypothetical protein
MERYFFISVNNFQKVEPFLVLRAASSDKMALFILKLFTRAASSLARVVIVAGLPAHERKTTAIQINFRYSGEGPRR